jgi:hypothetical protein
MLLSESEWSERFSLVASPGGEPVWEHDETLATPTERVWTIISTCEDDGLYVTPGYRYVNRLGYVVTTNPWPDLHCQGVWAEPTAERPQPSYGSTTKEVKMEVFEKLRDLILAAEEDAEKFYDKDNAAAGTRLRKALQEVKQLAQEIRIDVQEIKNNG